MLVDGRLYVGSDAEMDDAVLAALLADARLPALKELDLFGNRIGPPGVRDLMASAKTAGLTMLVLGRNPIGDDGATAIAARPWPALRQLGLAWTGMGPRGAAALVAAPALAALQRVEIGYQALGDEAVAPFARWSELISLSAAKTGLLGPGARALMEGGSAEALDLADNLLPEGALGGLGALSPRLRTLTLKSSGLGALDAAALAAVAAPGLKNLDLSMTKLGDDGVRALARAPWLGQLDSLNVLYAGAGPAGMGALAAAWGSRPGLTPGM